MDESSPHARMAATLSPRLVALLVACVLVSCCGAGCPQFLNEYGPSNGQILSRQPTFAEVSSLVNENSAKLQSLKSKARLSVGLFSVNADLIFDRPRRLRLRGGTRISGPEIDIGGNDNMFWFWIRRNEPGVFHCRHDQFARSNARAFLPVEPTWLIDALGITTFELGDRHYEPIRLSDGRLSVKSVVNRDGRQTVKMTLLDPASGVVLEQQIFDEGGKLIASAKTSNHARDPLSGAVLARDISIEWPASDFQMAIELSDVVINYLEGESDELWTMPAYDGSPPIDLADPRLQARMPVPQAAPMQAVPQAAEKVEVEESAFMRFFKFGR